MDSVGDHVQVIVRDKIQVLGCYLVFCESMECVEWCFGHKGYSIYVLGRKRRYFQKPFIFQTSISQLIIHLEISTFAFMKETFMQRELCVRSLICLKI